MFTGLIEQKGLVLNNSVNAHGGRLVIKAHFKQLSSGESIAINGVCLTLLESHDSELAFDISAETAQLTTLTTLSPSNYVNMERAMRADGRFGGHYVSGHVDTTAYVHNINTIADCVNLSVNGFNCSMHKYLLAKGSIAIDGVSLTINEVINNRISIMLVPHTLALTTFGQLQQGQRLNIEFDYLTRIVAHQLDCAKLTTS